YTYLSISLPQPPRSTLFPYTTLFRSQARMKPPESDAAFEISLRPPAFSEFNGQVKVRERLELVVEAAKRRRDVLEHVLLSGPSGDRKSTRLNSSHVAISYAVFCLKKK